MIYLENEVIKASFSPLGAELQELINKKNDENYLWKGDKQFWGKFSPILFPIVGGLKDNTYFFKNKQYHLSRHGFARDKEFEVSQLSDNELLFTLKNSAETLKIYPFEFVLRVRYRLDSNILSCSYEVSNPSEAESLHFSIGGHPAFSINTGNGINYSDYYLEFDTDEELIYNKIQNDLITDETQVIELNKNRLALTHELFYQDALVFKSLKSNRISLRNNKNENGLDFKFEGFPYFGIWAAKDADFVCLEPWCGIADVTGHNQNLEIKEGIMTLKPGDDWARRWSVSIF